jgi:hypothetical protein
MNRIFSAGNPQEFHKIVYRLEIFGNFENAGGKISNSRVLSATVVGRAGTGLCNNPIR